MNLATVVIATHQKAGSAMDSVHEFKQIQQALQPYEDRCLLAVDLLHGLPADRLSAYLSNIGRRKDLWIYHQLDALSTERIATIHRFFPNLKLLYVSHAMSHQQVNACFEQGIQALLITDKSDPSAYMQFAHKFYQNLAAGARLEEAYEQGRIFVEMEKGKAIGKPIAFSAWQQEQGAERGAISWGLIFQKEQADSLASFLPQRSQAKLASKQEQKNWRSIQRFKHLFLASWGQKKLYRQMLVVREGPLSDHLLCRMIGEEVSLLYETTSVKRLHIPCPPSLAHAKLALTATLDAHLDKHPFFTQIAPRSTKALVLLIKLHQSQWKTYSPQLLSWLVTEQLPALSQHTVSLDLVCILSLVEDVTSEERARKKGIQIRKIKDACKVFAADFTMDIRS